MTEQFLSNHCQLLTTVSIGLLPNVLLWLIHAAIVLSVRASRCLAQLFARGLFQRPGRGLDGWVIALPLALGFGIASGVTPGQGL